MPLAYSRLSSTVALAASSEANGQCGWTLELVKSLVTSEIAAVVFLGWLVGWLIGCLLDLHRILEPVVGGVIVPRISSSIIDLKLYVRARCSSVV